jgi:hypothetical protein
LMLFQISFTKAFVSEQAVARRIHPFPWDYIKYGSYCKYCLRCSYSVASGSCSRVVSGIV